jgi:1-acyl-sn-glycerol-3-phosphate acyltransferase
VARSYYAFMKFLTWIVGILLFDIRSFGSFRVPPHGSVVVAPNHQSYLDPLLVGMCVRRPLFYLARDTLFRYPILRSLLSALNALPIPRGGAASRRGIELGRAALRAENALVLFPEGTRTRSGSMGPLKRGVELVARPSAATVVPAYIDGSFALWPPHQRFPSCGKVRVFFGQPIPASGEGADGKSCSDLVSRLEASYRSLGARARRVRRTGAAGWRLHVSKATFYRREPPGGSGSWRAER